MKYRYVQQKLMALLKIELLMETRKKEKEREREEGSLEYRNSIDNIFRLRQ